MRILMISDVYFPRINGVSTSINTFKNELESLGHQVTLIVPHYTDTEDADPTIIRIPSRYLPL
ncbi:MAG: glycosyltransferase family 4 protein, partial [Gammaproteobacteria bacterium]|nr:glycosyltransferase family 4 protein [Gammaproteobacteria bacterium]